MSGQQRKVRSSVETDRDRLARGLDGVVHILACGSVDDGKSTLIGRLLWESSELPDDQREMVRRAARRAGTPDLLDYSLLLDGLVAEREQGITIDIAWRYVDTARRRLVIIDSPGHEQYTRNMTSGASHADVAVMLIDARHGIKLQTRRHAAILDLMGVRRVVLAVNKMDLVDWSEARFSEVERGFRAAVAGLGFVEAVAIPVSARHGDNVACRSDVMPWHTGPTLISHLESVPSRRAAVDAPFRMPVQTVLRDARDFRGLAGSIASGIVRVGDRVAYSATGRTARVVRIATMDGDLEEAKAGKAVALVLDADLDIARGTILAAPEALPASARHLQARLVWLAERRLDPEQDLLLRTATDLVPVTAIRVETRLALETLSFEADQHCQTNDVITASISLAHATALDGFRDSPATGSFLLVDPLTGNTLAAGVAIDVEVAERHAPVRRQVFRLTRALLADGLCSDLGTSEADTRELHRRAHEVEHLFRRAGVAVGLALADD